TKNFEATTVGENKRAWHTAEGMTYLYNNDLSQFDGDFWPTIDPNRLPGTTVDSAQPSADEAGKHSTGEPWVGGAEVGNRYGVVGMQLKGRLSPPEIPYNGARAKKSWFLFDDEIVALGADITYVETTGGVIETIVENRKIDSNTIPATLTVDNQAVTLTSTKQTV
ncbi:MAG: polysaccharide lyase family 8 super-sandwich domain-containing protein, partial [Verrucomicrobiota bacterium]